MLSNRVMVSFIVVLSPAACLLIAITTPITFWSYSKMVQLWQASGDPDLVSPTQGSPDAKTGVPHKDPVQKPSQNSCWRAGDPKYYGQGQKHQWQVSVAMLAMEICRKSRHAEEAVLLLQTSAPSFC